MESNRIRRLLSVDISRANRDEINVTLELANGDTLSLDIDSDVMGVVISDFLRFGAREARQNLPQTMRLGDGTRAIVELTAEEVDPRASFRTVDLVVRSGLVDVRLRVPTDKATVLARQIHQEAQTPRAKGE